MKTSKQLKSQSGNQYPVTRAEFVSTKDGKSVQNILDDTARCYVNVADDPFPEKGIVLFNTADYSITATAIDGAAARAGLPSGILVGNTYYKIDLDNGGDAYYTFVMYGDIDEAYVAKSDVVDVGTPVYSDVQFKNKIGTISKITAYRYVTIYME